jgi:putative oxidoreductase
MTVLKFYRKSYTDAGILFLRIAFGIMILLHGIGKLQDLMSGANDFPDPIGIGGTLSLALVTFAEFICAILLIIGLFTRLALVPLIITMLVVVFIHEAHLDLFDKEPPVLFLIAFVGLFFMGAGKYSIDEMINKKSGK